MKFLKEKIGWPLAMIVSVIGFVMTSPQVHAAAEMAVATAEEMAQSHKQCPSGAWKVFGTCLTGTPALMWGSRIAQEHEAHQQGEPDVKGPSFVRPVSAGR